MKRRILVLREKQIPPTKEQETLDIFAWYNLEAQARR